MHKKLQLSIMTSILCASLFFTSFVSGAVAGEFEDIGQHWAAEQIKAVYNLGLLFPVDKPTFEPERKITRAEFVSMLVKALDLHGEVRPSFTDVDLSKWYAGDLYVAKEQQLVKGGVDGLFRPEEPITRAEIAALIRRSFNHLEPDWAGGSFPDIAPDHWAYHDIHYVSQLGIIRGYEDQTFRPARSLTRAEAAVLIFRILSREEKAPVVGLATQEIQVDLAYLFVNQEEIVEDNSQGQESGDIELLPWTAADQLFTIGKTARITDVYTGRTFFVKRNYGVNHADVEPLTASDTQTMNEIWGGPTWDTRPIIVEVEGRRLAAAMHNMPHSIQQITDNNYDGHTCIHFLGSTKHKDGEEWPTMQRDVQIAANLF